MQNIQLPTITNTNTGGKFPAQHVDNRNTADFDIQCAFSDVSQGDILASANKQYFVVKTETISNRYATYLGVKAVRAIHKATISRNNNELASDIPCHALQQGLPDNELSKIICATSRSNKIHNTADLIQHLIDAAALIADDTSPLRQTLTAEIDQHSSSVRIILAAGSGVALGDQVTAGQHSVTVTVIDRAAYPGLELLSCSVVDATDTKNNLCTTKGKK